MSVLPARVLSTRLLKVVAAAVIVGGPLVATAAVASAKNAKGSAAWCAHHPKRALHTAACAPAGGGGGTGGGSGGTGPGPAPLLTVQVDPDPLVEFGASEAYAVVQVETSPSYAGDAVNIDSSQLQSSCARLLFEQVGQGSQNRISAVLDDDGNATVLLIGFDCAPGRSVIEADLESAPFLTALGTVDAEPPAVTAPGVTGFPTTSGVVTTGEVETGDTTASGDSDVYAVFYVETDPVYAEQTVEIGSAQLEDRCLTGWTWIAGSAGTLPGVATPQDVLDDDGNDVFAFMGSSCAAGTSAVIADVVSGTHPTYTGSFTVHAPAVTI